MTHFYRTSRRILTAFSTGFLLLALSSCGETGSDLKKRILGDDTANTQANINRRAPVYNQDFLRQSVQAPPPIVPQALNSPVSAPPIAPQTKTTTPFDSFDAEGNQVAPLANAPQAPSAEEGEEDLGSFDASGISNFFSGLFGSNEPAPEKPNPSMMPTPIAPMSAPREKQERKPIANNPVYDANGVLISPAKPLVSEPPPREAIMPYREPAKVVPQEAPKAPMQERIIPEKPEPIKPQPPVPAVEIKPEPVAEPVAAPMPPRPSQPPVPAKVTWADRLFGNAPPPEAISEPQPEPMPEPPAPVLVEAPPQREFAPGPPLVENEPEPQQLEETKPVILEQAEEAPPPQVSAPAPVSSASPQIAAPSLAPAPRMQPEGDVLYEDKVENAQKAPELRHKPRRHRSFLESIFGSDEEEEIVEDEKISYPDLTTVPAAPSNFKAVKESQPDNLKQLQADHENSQTQKQALENEPTEQTVSVPEKITPVAPPGKTLPPPPKPAASAPKESTFPAGAYQPYQPPARAPGAPQ